MTAPNRLAEYVEPRMDSARLARQYAAISERLAARGARSPLWLGLGVGAAVGALVVALALSVFAPAQDGAVGVVETNDSGQVLTLIEGSRIELEARTRLSLSRVSTDEVLLELGNGGVAIEASHRPGRRFVVRSGGYDVRVVGTRFAVRLDGSHGRALEVTVERGVVEVARSDGDDARQLRAGERWAVILEPPASAQAADPEAKPLAEPATAASATNDPSIAASATNDSSPSATDAAPPSAAAVRVETAKQLFERAQRARAAGRNAEARAAFLELRRRYPHDSRASLAAFELARIELDDKKDPKRAVKLLDDALKNAPTGAPHREDIEARRVEALAAAGDVPGCKKARDAYLARHPQGLYRARVTKACP